MQNNLKRYMGENFWVWFIKIISGLVIVLFLGLHFVVNHLVAPGGLLSYADVIQYYSNPIIPIIEILFLITVVPHAILGIRGIFLDLNPSPKSIKVVDILFLTLGTLAILYGIWLVIVLANR